MEYLTLKIKSSYMQMVECKNRAINFTSSFTTSRLHDQLLLKHKCLSLIMFRLYGAIDGKAKS